MLRLFVLLFLAVGCGLHGARAQDAPRQPWSVSASHAVEAPQRSGIPWHTTRVAAQRRWAQGAMLVEGGRVERFDRAAAFGAAEAYRTLWPMAYGYARLLLAPEATTSAQSDAAMELFQNLPGGWEASGGVRRLAFVGDDAWLATASAARYAGDWLVRLRVVADFAAERPGVSPSVSARYLRDAAAGAVPAFEVSAGQGREVIADAPAPAVSLRRTWFVAARGSWAVHPHALVVGGGSFAREGGTNRPGVEVGVQVRW